MKDIEFDYILIASGNFESVKEELLKHGIDESIICGYIFEKENNTKIQEALKLTDNFIKQYLNLELTQKIMSKWKAKGFHAVTMWHENTQEGFDFVRIQTLYLLAQQILDKNISGAIAECGVFKGEFARIINRFFKDRQLYLFDTFEGFSIDDIKSEFGSTNFFDKGFKNTNADAVLESMPYKENCTIKQGYFPDTFDLGDEKFAFVSLDMDLYKPMKDALEIFYPRLSKGGYIMAHDYHNKVFKGTKQAIDEFCQENGVTITPIADLFGSVLITK